MYLSVLSQTIAMKRLGIPIQVFTPENVSLAKKKMLEAYDANLVLHGLDVVDTEHEARRLSEVRSTWRLNLPASPNSQSALILFALETVLVGMADLLEAVFVRSVGSDDEH